MNRLLKRRSFADSVFSVRYFVWSGKVWTSQMLLWHVKVANILRPMRSSWLPFVHSVYTVNLLRLFHLAAIWSNDIFDTVNLSFWGWSIGSASRSCALYGTLYWRHDPHSRPEIRDASPGKLDLNPQSKGGSCRSKSQSCNISEVRFITNISNRSVVLLQPNVKSLKIAAAVNDVNKKLVIGEAVQPGR